MIENHFSDSSMLLNLTSEAVSTQRNTSQHNDQDNQLQKEDNLSKISAERSQRKTKARNKVKISQANQTDVPFSKSKTEKDHSSSLFTSNPITAPLIIHKDKNLPEPLFSSKTFSDLSLHPHLVACLISRFNIKKLTFVQEQTIPLLLSGVDTLVKSCTGSGKTLAYAVPIVQNLLEISPQIKRSDGVLALIIVPTRELALQCFETFSLLTKACNWVVPGYLIGGEKKKAEKARLRKGINVLISTPGRLLDHLERTVCLSLERINWLVIDEADNLSDQGFESSVSRILSHCNSARQSVLLSATLSKGVEKLAGMSLSNPKHVDISAKKDTTEFHDLTLPANLKQFVMVVPPKLRLVVLSSFIVEKCCKGGLKGVIFMSSQNSVDFHYSLLSDVLATHLQKSGHECKFFALYGSMKQEERTGIFKAFRAVKDGVLFCTDVGARGLDLPHINWIVQYSAPISTEIYVHRVGRTARIGKKGNSLLFLLPTEAKFSDFLVSSQIHFEEVPSNQYLPSLNLLISLQNFKKKSSTEELATALQMSYEKTVYKEEELHMKAKKAYSSYIESYLAYPKNVRQILPFKSLHLGHTAKSFCLNETPSQLGRTPSDLKPSPQKKNAMKRKHHLISEYDNGFSALKSNKGRKGKRQRKR